jgi:hypothetical protein
MLNNILNGWRQFTTKLLIICGLLYLIAVCIPVLAASIAVDTKWQCLPTKELSASLSGEGESVIGSGLIDGVFFVTLWNSLETGTWSVVVTPLEDQSMSCIVLYGQQFKSHKHKLTI